MKWFPWRIGGVTEIRMRFADGIEIRAVLVPKPTETVRKLVEVLPFTSTVHRWGDEIYFDAPFHACLESNARADMDVGDVAFWPDGDAIAVFFGRTPASVDERPRAYSPCNILGRVFEDVSVLRRIKDGVKVEVLA